MPSPLLVNRLGRRSVYETQFTTAENLMQTILNNQIPVGLQVISTFEDYYNDHGIGHIKRAISKLEALDKLLDNRNRVNQKEAFVLLVATYFHDIGMFLGRRNEEDPVETRAEHHVRSKEIVQWLSDNGYLDISELELSIIMKLIEAHRVIDIEVVTENQRIEGSNIRTRLLGALLRIADSCDCDRSRAPKAIFELYYEYIPAGSRQYWEAHFPVADVSFSSTRASIVVEIDLGTDLMSKIEKHRIANRLQRKLSRELKSVEETFRLNNVCLVRVEAKNFNTGEWKDLSRPPANEDAVIVTV